jgi:YHS domain-containing protein
VFRALFYLIAVVLAISVIRSIVGVLSKAFSEFTNPSSEPSRPRTRTVPPAESLKKDPVCGTYIAPSTAIVQLVNGEKLYFCSPACRDKFKKA